MIENYVLAAPSSWNSFQVVPVDSKMRSVVTEGCFFRLRPFNQADCVSSLLSKSLKISKFILSTTTKLHLPYKLKSVKLFSFNGFKSKPDIDVCKKRKKRNHFLFPFFHKPAGGKHVSFSDACVTFLFIPPFAQENVAQLVHLLMGGNYAWMVSLWKQTHFGFQQRPKWVCFWISKDLTSRRPQALVL